jgi:transcription elongation factor GreB
VSRAFVDEDDQSPEQDVPEIRIPLPAGAKNYVTPAGAAKLQEELARLDRDERPHLAAAVARMVRGEGAGAAESDPDRLERSRRRLREIQRRIEYLNRMIVRLQVIEPEPSGSGGSDGPEGPPCVQFGVPVVVQAPEGGPTEYRIVGVDESEPERGLVSWISPLGRALTGARAGDRVEVDLPDGRAVLHILAVGTKDSIRALEKKAPDR